jgi:hypothetical protein
LEDRAMLAARLHARRALTGGERPGEYLPGGVRTRRTLLKQVEAIDADLIVLDLRLTEPDNRSKLGNQSIVMIASIVGASRRLLVHSS